MPKDLPPFIPSGYSPPPDAVEAFQTTRQALGDQGDDWREAKRSIVLSDEGTELAVPHAIWRDDAQARTIWKTGRIRFHPHKYKFHWSSTGAFIEGRVLILENMLGQELTTQTAIPDIKAATHQLTQEERRKGGGQHKHDTALQSVINKICDNLSREDIKVTLGAVEQRINEKGGPRDPWESKVSDCDDVFFEGNTLHWHTGTGSGRKLALKSLERYISRWKRRQGKS